MATLEILEQRVTALESKRFTAVSGAEIVVDDNVRRARQAVQDARCYSSVWKFVPEHYYNQTLNERAALLGAPSIHNLCKSLLLENKKAPVSSDPTNPRFVLVVLQYASTLSIAGLVRAVRQLRPVPNRLPENGFDFRIAESVDNDRITGYKFNSVTPFGLHERPLIIVSSALEELRFFWMGGGHVHLKLGMTFTDFCKGLDPAVADISTPRTSLVGVDDDDEL